MLNSVFSIDGYDPNGAQQGCYPHHGFEDKGAGKQVHFFTSEDMGLVADDLWSIYGLAQDSAIQKGSPPSGSIPQPLPEFSPADNINFNPVSAPVPQLKSDAMLGVNVDKPLVHGSSALARPKEKASARFLSSLDLPNSYKPSHTLSHGEKINATIGKGMNLSGGGKVLSTEESVRVAAARYIELSTSKEGENSILENLVNLSSSGFTNEEVQNIELMSLLLSAADKISSRQYDHAINFLRQCNTFSSHTGNPVQRVVRYFSDALQEKIDRETGVLFSKKTWERGIPGEDVIKEMLASHPMHLVTQKAIPFSQVVQFTSIQTILDNVATMKRIHLINLSIKHGIQCTILMQALAMRSSCPVDYLKITGVGSTEEAQPLLITGQRLISFAESLGLPFDFRPVTVADMKDLKEDVFEVEPEEALAVYSSMNMNSMIVRPQSLNNLIRVIRKLKPRIMAVVDIEANHNSPSFIARFTEALFFYSAYFDCVDSCLDRDDMNRIFLEGYFFAEGIRSIVATEGSERLVRHVGVNVWRSFFTRFGFVEADLNAWSSYQGSLLVKQFANGSSYTFDNNGKSLTIGWKGTPLYFISAWKFH